MKDRIDTLLNEQRSFPPPSACRAAAHVKDDTPYERCRRDRERYRADWARQLEGFRLWDKVLEWKPPPAKWFVSGKRNASVNCLDRHVRGGKADKVALVRDGEPEPREVRKPTYGDDSTGPPTGSRTVLTSLGVGRGDRVAIYKEIVPEVAVAMLACARIGAPHTVVFGGFSAESLRDRVNDCEAKVLVTADGGHGRGAVVPLKRNADQALEGHAQHQVRGGAAAHRAGSARCGPAGTTGGTR